MLNQL